MVSAKLLLKGRTCVRSMLLESMESIFLLQIHYSDFSITDWTENTILAHPRVWRRFGGAPRRNNPRMDVVENGGASESERNILDQICVGLIISRHARNFVPGCSLLILLGPSIDQRSLQMQDRCLDVQNRCPTCTKRSLVWVPYLSLMRCQGNF